ncbi:MAG TPA: hypothetical protein VHX13_09550 [Acidobacteriaceae bacterium]|jgi:hypothetical protein|nr:hypothetical protein [Acidobacteriaceae bacterium]
MNSAAFAGLLAGVLLAGGQTAPQGPSAPSSGFTERIESGQIASPSGAPVYYRIRLLPLSSFPALPEEVAAQLSRRQCMIPQTFEAKQPENVIHGAFHAPGSGDWAALCSAGGTTTLYVFFAAQLDNPIALRSQPDTAWLGADPGESVLGSAWGIATRTADQLRSSPEWRHLLTIDHDAIDDARLERSLTIRYDQEGKWLALDAGDADDNNATPTSQDYLLAIAKATAPIPNICSGGVTASLGKASVSLTLGPGNAGFGGFQGSASYGNHSVGSTTAQNEGAT